MNPTYLIMVMRNNQWDIIDAWATKALAFEHVEVHKAAAVKRMGYAPRGGWDPKRGVTKSLGRQFPGRALKAWSATSTGGIDGNTWGQIAVVELEVQGTVLDQIADI